MKERFTVTAGRRRAGVQQVASRRRAVGTMVTMASGIVLVGLTLPFVFGQDVASTTALRSDQRSTSFEDGATSTTPSAGEGSDGASPLDAGASATDTPPPAPSAAAGSTTVPPPDPVAQGGEDRPAGGVARPGGEVEIGILLLDLGGASRVGFGGGGLANADEQRRIFEAYVAEWNDQGGIGGREIKPVFAKFDPLDGSSQRRACLALTEDADVFAVLEASGGFNGASVLCFTEEHRTPFFTGAGLNNTSTEVERRSGGRMFGLSMRGVRMLENAALIWDRQGLLEDATIGILDSAELGNPETVDAGLISTLKRLGHPVAKRVIFSTEPSTAASQVPTAVQEMRAAGVDVIVNATNGLYTAQFTQQADAQAYRPRYLASDWALNGTDFTAQNNGRGYDGTPLVTVYRGNDIGRVPMSQPERRCQEIYARRIGEPPPRDPAKPNAWTGFAVRCAVVEYFVQAARAAGSDLTHGSLAAGVHSLGQLEVALFLPGAFRPGKPDLADHYWIQEWRFDCRCHRVVSGPHLAPVR